MMPRTAPQGRRAAARATWRAATSVSSARRRRAPCTRWLRMAVRVLPAALGPHCIGRPVDNASLPDAPWRADPRYAVVSARSVDGTPSMARGRVSPGTKFAPSTRSRARVRQIAALVTSAATSNSAPSASAQYRVSGETPTCFARVIPIAPFSGSSGRPAASTPGCLMGRGDANSLREQNTPLACTLARPGSALRQKRA